MEPPPATFSKTGKSKAVVLVKASPQASGTHGETVCVAALDEYGGWHRLYPVNFRGLDKSQRFGRWDQIEFEWRLPEVNKDRRAESKRIVQSSVKVIGKLKQSERQRYLEKAIIEDTQREYEEGRSLSLIRPENPRFYYRRRSEADMESIRRGYDEINNSPDLFGTTDIVPREVAPYEFCYRYDCGGKPHDQRCHDWETEQTFLNWRDRYDETRALADMHQCFGEEYPKKGMAFAMGTHGQRNWQWMIIGVLRVDKIAQPSFL